MKISFPKYGPGELLIEERGARCIISSVIIGFFAGLCGSYLLQNKFWLLTIALIGIAGILLCLGGAAGIFLKPRASSSIMIRSTKHLAPTAHPAPTSAKTCRESLCSGIIGPKNRFGRTRLATTQTQKRPMVSVQILSGWMIMSGAMTTYLKARPLLLLTVDTPLRNI